MWNLSLSITNKSKSTIDLTFKLLNDEFFDSLILSTNKTDYLFEFMDWYYENFCYFFDYAIATYQDVSCFLISFDEPRDHENMVLFPKSESFPRQKYMLLHCILKSLSHEPMINRYHLRMQIIKRGIRFKTQHGVLR